MTGRQVPAQQAAGMARRAAVVSWALAIVALGTLLHDHRHASTITIYGLLLLLGLYNTVACLIRAAAWRRP